MQAAAIPIAVALALAGACVTGCQEIQAVLGTVPAIDAGSVTSAQPPIGRSIQGIPILAGAEVAYAGYLENDYQIELQSRTVALVDALRFYDAMLRQQGWQLTPPAPDGLAQVLRGTRDGRILTARFEPRETGTSIQFLLVTAPSPGSTDSYAPVRDPAADADAGAGAAASPAPRLPDGVPQPTGYRLVSHRGLAADSWEVVFEVDASADQALGRLTSEMGQMGWRFGSGGARAPVAAPQPGGSVVGSRGGVTVTIRASESMRANGDLVATLRLVGAAGVR